MQRVRLFLSLLCLVRGWSLQLGSTSALKLRLPYRRPLLAMSQSTLAEKIIEKAFSIRPLFKLAAGVARSSIVKQGAAIGVDWEKETQALYDKMNTLENYFSKFNSPKLEYPSYYLKPFHAYDEGNLSWQAAVEVEAAALSVHAHIYTPSRKILDINGDFMLRDNFHKNMMSILSKSNVRPIRQILDIGCSTGLSTLKLHDTFPDAEIIGCDLSPYMLAVARLRLEDDNHRSAQGKVEYLHSAGEATPLNDNSVDLVSICLVSHELPQDASRSVFQEAYRVLRPGGVLSFMGMNPRSEAFQRFAANTFAFQAFRSTEPWLLEYISLDLEAMLQDCGFSEVTMIPNSPRHRTVVAMKK